METFCLLMLVMYSIFIGGSYVVAMHTPLNVFVRLFGLFALITSFVGYGCFLSLLIKVAP